MQQHPGLDAENIIGGPVDRNISILPVGRSLAYVERSLLAEDMRVVFEGKRTDSFPFIHSVRDIGARVSFIARTEKGIEHIVHGNNVTETDEKVEIGSLTDFEGKPIYITRAKDNKRSFVNLPEVKLGPYDSAKELRVINNKPTFIAREGDVSFLVHGTEELFKEFKFSRIFNYDFEDDVFCIFGECSEGSAYAVGDRLGIMPLHYAGGVLFSGEALYKGAEKSQCGRFGRPRAIYNGSSAIVSNPRHCGSPDRTENILAFWYKMRDKARVAWASKKDPHLSELVFDHAFVWKDRDGVFAVGHNDNIWSAYVLQDWHDLVKHELTDWKRDLVLNTNGIAYVAEVDGKQFVKQDKHEFPCFDKVSNLAVTANGLVHVAHSGGKRFVVEYRN